MSWNTKEKGYWKKIFSQMVNQLENRGYHADILFIDEKSLRININYSTTEVNDTAERGLKIRVYDGTKYEERYTTNLEPAHLLEFTRLFAESLPKRKKIAPAKKQFVKHFVRREKKKASSISIDKKISEVNKAVQRLKRNKFIKNVRVIYHEIDLFKAYYSSEKYFTQYLPSVVVATLVMVPVRDGTGYDYASGIAPGYEAVKLYPELIKNVLFYGRALKKSRRLPPGKYYSLLSPEISGLLAHESFGHGSESDTVYKGRAKSVEFAGKRIADRTVSIVDDPSLANLHGSYFFDDEGMISKPTHMIKNGIVKDFLTESYSAERLNVSRSANARCESFDHKSYARMSNTFFAKGKTPMKKMLAKIKDGIYLIKGSGGMEDPKGWGIQIQGVLGQRIKNGKPINEYYSDIGITGYLPIFLGNIEAVSKEWHIKDTGFCGKGHKEWVPVSSGGPYLLVKEVDLA